MLSTITGGCYFTLQVILHLEVSEEEIVFNLMGVEYTVTRIEKSVCWSHELLPQHEK